MKVNYILILTLLTIMAGIFTSCNEDEDLPNGGEPFVSYVRVTDPISSDSLLVSAYQGSVIAIMGGNLQDTREIWFNDRKANLSPTYVTSNTIITTVPSAIPNVITDRMKLIFSNGDSLLSYFHVAISTPVVTSMRCEYVLTGEEATIRGNFFYEPLTVTFTGGVVGEIVDVEETVIHVTVPEGAEPGPITVTTNFGEIESNFWFRDNRNIFISSDPFTGWWNESFVVTDPGSDDPPAINGNYIRVKRQIAGWSWVEVVGGPADAMGDISKNVPDDAILHPEDYNLKFEVNTLLPYNNNVIKINVGLQSENNDHYKWQPPYDSKGEWETVVIPFEKVTENFDLQVNPNGYWTRILFHGPGDLDADISFDNFRVVPKTIQ